jgi:DNA helicase IV
MRLSEYMLVDLHGRMGLTLRPENAHRLSINYRNTKEIARFAASIVDGIEVDDDGSLPDFNSCDRNGPKPIVLKGNFGKQLDYVISYLRSVDLDTESVAFLHTKGGGWFDAIRGRLLLRALPFAEITRQSEWPAGDENIALSTLHSAKGLEFDHVIILGLNAETVAHGDEDDDDRLSMLRRLLAMAVGRAKLSVIVGYKPSEASRLIDFFDANTFEEVDV